MEPLKITWEFLTPVVSPQHHIHLDALLAWVNVQRAMEDQLNDDPFASQLDLPLEKDVARNVFKASVLFFEPKGSLQCFQLNKRYEIESFAEAKDTISVFNKNTFPQGSGRYKAFSLRVFAQPMVKAVAYCIGDPDVVAEMLEEIHCIGKLKRIQMGKIKRVINADGEEVSCLVERCDKANDLWRVRHLPVVEGQDIAEGYTPAMVTCRPPYFNMEYSCLCETPITPASFLK